MSEEKKSSVNLSLIVAIISFAAFAILWWLNSMEMGKAIHLCFLMSQTIVISIVIWQVCDPFADAAQWIGQRWKIPGSVRGATLDAVASSMPELFSGIFFVVVAVTATDKDLVTANGEGFGATVATCAGSAVYNMILIPAMCALFISYVRTSRPTIDIEERVISRDGMWFLGTEVLLIVFLFSNEMHWWMALVLLATYVIYVLVLVGDAKKFRQQLGELNAKIAEGATAQEAIDQMRADGQKISRDMADRIHDLDDDEDDDDESAGVLFGLLKIPLNSIVAWSIIFICTVLAAGACYWLVKVTYGMAESLNVPLFFVAVIIAAAASSVPDTFLSIASARRGDDDGAVSNAFGSNIFDITICLSVPLLVGCYLNGWQPVALVDEHGETIEGLVWLRVILCVLSVVTLLIMWHNRQLTRFKAIILCLLYAAFVGYAVFGSLGML